MENLDMFYNSYQSANSSLEKISGVLEEKPTVLESKTPVKLGKLAGAITFNNVSFNYSNDVKVLEKMQLAILPGQTVALVGTTGAGKSTIAKLVARFYDPTAGEVLLDETNLRNVSSAELRKTVVMVTQEAYLFSGSVADNIALGKPDATPEEIEAAAKAVGAHDFIMALPDGYSTDVNKRGGRVSSGQRQLISFARAFIADPAVLILDEATSSLDVPSERLVQQGLKTLLNSRTAIIIAHRLSTVAIADRVLVLEHGKVIEDGTPKELISGTGKFSRMHKAWRDSLV
jgi:ATP-binding cassette subfamily B protein